MIIHSAAGAMGSVFNSPVAGAYLSFNSRASTPAGKQCWMCSVRLQQTMIVQCSVVDTCRLLLRLQNWRSITNGLSKEQLNTRKGPKHQTREPADRSEVLAHVGGI